MIITEAYEKYKHLDALLSDPGWNETPTGSIAHDLWLAVKAEVEAKRLEGRFVYETASGHDPIPYNDNPDNCQLCGAHVGNHTPPDPEAGE